MKIVACLRSHVLIKPSAIFSLALPALAFSLECEIQASSVVLVGAGTGFQLVCDDSLDARISWEFGDNSFLDSTDSMHVTHKYSMPGGYTVFARIAGEAIPASTFITVINPPASVASTYATTVLLDPNRNTLWNVNVDNSSVTVISTVSLKKIKEIPVGQAPRTLTQDSLGRIWVANQDDATLTVIDGNTLEVAHTYSLPYASRPFGVCADPAGTSIFVSLEATGKLLRLDAATGSLKGEVKVFPTPRGIAVAPDGKTLLLTRFISPKHRGEIARIDLTTMSQSHLIPLAYDETQDSESNGGGVPNALSFIIISPEGKRAWVPYKKDNVKRGLYVNPGGQAPTFESTVRTGISQIDLETNQEIGDARVDLDNRSMACAIAFDHRGLHAYVATETSNDIAIFNAFDHTRITAIEPNDLHHELSPAGLVTSKDDSLLFVHNFMSREVAVYDITAIGGSNVIPKVALVSTVEKEKMSPQVLRGKQVFYNAADSRMSRHKYISCAVCHLDGGSDGRVWDFTHKSEGLRYTPSLRGRAGMGQGPVHWSANFDEIQDFENDIRGHFMGSGFIDGLLYMQGTRNQPLGDPKSGLSPELDDLAAYVASLTASRPSPHRNSDGALTQAAIEGEKVFNRTDVGCAICHPSPNYTASHLRPPESLAAQPGGYKTSQGFILFDVGTLNPGSGMRDGQTLKGLDTPTLAGLWEKEVFLHDGSVSSLRDVLTIANPDDKHGKTSHLSSLEIDQLVAFLQQIEVETLPAAIRPIPKKIQDREVFSVSSNRHGPGILFAVAGSPMPPTLEIWNLSGRLERGLKGSASIPNPKASRANTSWSLAWDGRNASGIRSKSGTYIIRARSADQSATLKIHWIP